MIKQILIKFLKSRVFLLGSTAILTLVVWWVVATMFDLSLTIKLLGIVVLLFVYVVILIVGFIRADRNAAAIEQSILAGADNQMMSTRPDRREAITEMRQRLEAAIGNLKKSKLRSGWKGRGALYALPWYLFIGPPGSGKTTALANSGLNFPMGFDRIRGVGGTRDCDWFFSDSGIFLDTAGRWVTDEDDEEFSAFLEVLKENRTRQPINGVLLALSMKDLATLGHVELEEHAIRLRRRISDLIEKLGVRFPVYVLFTKCDLIPGFVETFGHLTSRERERIWGTTIPAENWAGSADKVFDEEFDHLLKQIVNRRHEQLKHGLKREVRSKVFSFPMEIASLRQRVSLVLSHLFQANPYQETAIFRGFYFTSGTQEGAPIDSVIREIARQFDVQQDAPESAPDELTTKSYFIHDVFQQVVVPDQFLARQTSRATSKLKKTQVAVALSAIIGLAVCVLLVIFATFRSTSEVENVENAALFASGARFEEGTDLSFELTKLSRLATVVDEVEENSFRPLMLGLRGADDIVEPATRLFVLKVRELAEARVVPELERQILTATRGGSPGQSGNVASADLYRLLRAYMLLTTESGRLAEEDQKAFLVTEMEAALRASALAGGTLLDVPDLQNRLRSFVDALAGGEVRGLPHQDTIVRRAQLVLVQGGSTGAVGVYLRMRQKGQAELRPLRLTDMLQGTYVDLVESELSVDGLFTKDGWLGYMYDEVNGMGASGQSEEWVLGRQAAHIDTAGLKAQIEQLYFRDYASAWSNFLRQVRVRPFANTVQAAQNLRILSREGDSPITLLLAETARQTTLQEPRPADDQQRPVDDAVSAVTGGPSSDFPSSAKIVTDQFKWLADYRPADMATQGGLPIGQALQSLGRVGSYIETFAGDENATTDAVADILTKSGGDLEFELRSIRGTLGRMDPDLRNNLFDTPVENAWATMLDVAQNRLNALWKRDVYDVQDDLLKGDPIAPDGFGEIPIRDFDDFFRPEEGIFDVFVSTHLTPFVEGDLSGARSWRRRGVVLSRSFLQVLEKANEIQAGLFPRGELRLEFDLRAELPQRDASAPVPSLTVLTLHGTTYRYSMGVTDWVQFAWPGPPGALLSITTDSGPLPERRYEGNWAIFKMLSDARIRAGSSRAIYIVELPTDHGIVLPYEMRFDSRRNPFGDPDFFDFRPPQRLN